MSRLLPALFFLPSSATLKACLSGPRTRSRTKNRVRRIICLFLQFRRIATDIANNLSTWRNGKTAAQIIIPMLVLITAVAKIAQRWLSFGNVLPVQLEEIDRLRRATKSI